MEAVIPETVMQHLRELNDPQSLLAGGFTTRQLAEELGVGPEAARRRIRQMYRAGSITSRKVALTEADAHELGYLGGCKLIVYYPAA